MEHTPRPNQIYRHFKGNLYRVITLAKHTETGETLVIYQALYDGFEIYARPLESFLGEVDRAKYPDEKEKKRFTLVREIFGQEAGERTIPDPERIKERPSTLQAEEQKDAVRLQEGKTACPHLPESREMQTFREVQTLREMQLPQEMQTSREAHNLQEIQNPDTTEAGGEEEFRLDPRLLEFLEADSYEEKLNILVGMHSRLTWEMLRTAAVSLDIELEEKDLEEGYRTLKNCLLTLEKYECTRLR